MDLSSTERRVAGRGALAVGLLPLLLPELVVDAGRFVAEAALDVSVVPRDRTARRVRLLGGALALGGLALSLSRD